MRLARANRFMLWLLAASACHGPSEPGRVAPEGATVAAKTPTPPAEAKAAPSSTPTEALEPQPYRRTEKMMGTVISVTVEGVPEAQASRAVTAALEEMKRLERVLSEWIDTSEISKINAAAGKEAVPVSPDTMKVIQAGIEISRWSDGAFDLSWAALRGLYTFQPGEENVPDLAEVKQRAKLVDHRKIIVDERAQTVMLGKTGMALGTGAIAKGYALDRASEILRDHGIANFMIFGGGQVQVQGQRQGRAWRVGIQHPREQDYFGFVEASSGSISTSGDYEHSFIKDGRRWHHIIDAKTGLPVPHTTSVTVLADSGLYADVLSTAVFVLGAKKALPRLAKAPGNPRVAIVDSELRLHTNPAMQKALILRQPLTDGKLPGEPKP